MSLNDCTSAICKIETVLLNIISVYALFLTICGTITNSFSALVCRSPKLKKNTTFIILFFVFIFKIPSMYTWNLDVFLLILPKNSKSPRTEFQIDQQNIIESLSIPTCKIFTFSQFFSLHCISWLLTYMSIDQVIKVYFPHSNFFNIRKTYLFSFLIILILFFLNGHILLFLGVIKTIEFNNTIKVNETLVNSTVKFETINCYESNFYSFYPTWDQIHLAVFCFVPFSIMIVCNLLMRLRLEPAKSLKTSSNDRKMKRRRQISRFIIIYSFLFMISTLPQIICFGFFFSKLFSTRYGRIVLNMTDMFTFSFVAFNFLALFKINSLYKKNFWLKLKMLCIFRNNIQDSSTKSTSAGDSSLKQSSKDLIQTSKID